MGTSENKETVRRIYDAMSRGDRSEFAASVRPDYVWRLAGHSSWSRRFEGREAIQRELLGPLFALFATRYTARAVNIVGDGDFVVAEVRGDVETHCGARYDNEYCFVFRFEGSHIAEVTEYGDTELIERVLGPYEQARASPTL
jgi:ketosteroid isomerase-like protein